MTLDVFFSYDSDDRLIVNRIKDGIEARANGEVDIYIYEDDLQPGTAISENAKKRIREADLFLVLITPNSQDSAWVQQEVGFADGKVQIVPIMLDVPEKPELKGLLAGREYLTFDQDRPTDFFRDFMDYARRSGLLADDREPSEDDEHEKGYLSPLDSPNEGEHIIIESSVEVYRRDDDRHEVVAETDGQIVSLGIRDATVSRKNDGPAPVVFEPIGPGRVTLHNNGTTNPVTVDHGVGIEPTTIQNGDAEMLTDTCMVTIGYNTKLKLGFRHDTVDVEELVSSQSNVTRDGAVVKGVPPALYVREATNNLLNQAKHGSRADCLKTARNLHGFVDEHPVSASDYDQVCDQLEELVTRLDATLSGSSRHKWPDSEWIEQFELVSDRLGRLYSRDARNRPG